MRHSGGMAKPALGRGLGALLGGDSIAQPPSPTPPATAAQAAASDPRPRVQQAPLQRINPCPFQPRKEFSPETLRELADSIQEQGIVQPLIVREREGRLELIAGERRWRAAQLLGLAEVPVIVREADDRAVSSWRSLKTSNATTSMRLNRPMGTPNSPSNSASPRKKSPPRSARAAPW